MTIKQTESKKQYKIENNSGSGQLDSKVWEVVQYSKGSHILSVNNSGNLRAKFKYFSFTLYIHLQWPLSCDDINNQ